MNSPAVWASLVSLWQSCGANALPVMPVWRSEYDVNHCRAVECGGDFGSAIACAGSTEIFLVDPSTGLPLAAPLATVEASRLAGCTAGNTYGYDRWSVYCLNPCVSGTPRSWRSDSIRTGRGSDDGDPEFLQVLVGAAPLADGIAVLRSDGMLCELASASGSPKWKKALGPMDDGQLLADSNWVCVLYSGEGKSRAVAVDLRKPEDAPRVLDISNGDAIAPLGAWICNSMLVLAWNDCWTSQSLDEPAGLKQAHRYPAGVHMTRARLAFGWPADNRNPDRSRIFFAGDDGSIYADLILSPGPRVIGAVSRRQMERCPSLELLGNALILSGTKAAFRIDLSKESAGGMQQFESRGPIELFSVEARQMLGFIRSPQCELNERLWFLIDFSDASGATNRIRPLMTAMDVRSVLWLEQSLILVGPDEIQCFAR